MKRCCIFSRVSSLAQSTQEQTKELLNEAYKNGYTDDDIEIIDCTESAIKLSESERISIQKLYNVIDNNPIECVICRELSRIARRPDVLFKVRDYLIQRQIQLIICQPYMRLLDEKGKLSHTANMIFSIFSSIAESEMDIKKERFREGKLRKKNAGKWAGGWLPYGYGYDKDTHDIIVIPEQRDIILKIFDMYVNKGMSTYRISRHLNQTGELNCCKTGSTVETAVSTIGSMLKNRAYIGEHPVYRGKIVDNVYPQIVDKSLFEQAAIRLDQHNSRKNAHIQTVGKHIYFCSDILVDQYGHKLIGKSAANSYRYVRHDNDGTNYQITVPINLVDSVVWHFTKLYITFNKPLSNVDALSRLGDEHTTLINILKHNKKRTSEIDDSLIKINERIVTGKMNEKTGDVLVKKFEDEKDNLETEFVRIMFEVKVLDDKIESLKKNVESNLDNLTNELIHELIHKYVEKVKVVPTDTWGEYDLTVKYYDMNIDYATIKSMSKRAFDPLGHEIHFTYMARFDRSKK